MAKVLLSPLFLANLALILGLIYLRLQLRKNNAGKISAFLTSFLLLVSVLLWIVSTPLFASSLAGLWEQPYAQPGKSQLAGQDFQAVTVLSGGIYRGPLPEWDQPGDGTMHRLYRGAKIYRMSEANYLILQGSLAADEPARMVELMKKMAVELGIEENHILLEPNSLNTRQHPPELLQLDAITADTNLAVVTSAWHLRRAEMEFERHFSNITPVPAEFISRDQPGGVRNLLPRVHSLRNSTKIMHEFIGILWYWTQENW